MASLDDGIGRLRNAAGHLADAANAVAGVFAAAVRPIVGPIAGNWDRLRTLPQIGDAEGALCPLAV